jgi:hypothetical protein
MLASRLVNHSGQAGPPVAEHRFIVNANVQLLYIEITLSHKIARYPTSKVWIYLTWAISATNSTDPAKE